MKEYTNRIGETNKNIYGSTFKIIEYICYSKVYIEFDNGYKTWTTYRCFKNGGLKSPYCKTVMHNGFLGEGLYSTKKNHLIYQYWVDILKRSFSDGISQKWNTYKEVTVCEEWLNFQNFAKWFDENYYTVENEKIHIDKDILIKGNKIYSPETCVFVPQRINELFIKSNRIRGEFPIGVGYLKRLDKYQSNCKSFVSKGSPSYSNYLGIFKTPEEAFNSYKKFKENYIKEVADKYKDSIPNKLYEAMYKYKVEITD